MQGAAGPFEAWLVEARGLSEATARKHRENAETFLSFLSDCELVPLAAVTEYDLRSFLYDWYPRKVVDAASYTEAMPVSLGHFFGWLAEERGVRCRWAEAALGEREAYTTRHVAFPGGFWWDEEVQLWQAELWADLDARVMLHDPGLGARSEWGEEGPMGRAMGMIEARLDRELERRWLLWRDEEIRGGLAEAGPLRTALVRRQREWERSPHADLEGETPERAIERERAERRERVGARER